MTEQLQLPIRSPAPAVDAADLALFVGCLANASGWLKARDLMTLLDFDDRKLRALANASRGTVISGQRGYRLTRHATIEEIDRCTAMLRSQSKAMDQRALEISRVYHCHKAIS
jgi:hypothetical protein